MLLDLDGKLVADSNGPALEGATFPFPTLIHAAQRNGDASSIGMIGGRPYQLVAVPVKAPVTIAWITMGFLIDDKMASAMLHSATSGKAEAAGRRTDRRCFHTTSLAVAGRRFKSGDRYLPG
ncbi:hypothetical protein SBC1_79550 (plasmid) [Caballeronia sp. SBC1]|uniref:hypothetical protein n=1 Tax=Caballeronia sp. SBC1 TaxID=2705548 RepID=UPI00140E9F7A|nr:hypothetical protein SBC1_79550 [Caballeronia sp. SBC1]